MEKKNAEEERARAAEVVKKLAKVNERATMIKREEEVEAKAIRAVEIRRLSSEFDALTQDAYEVALEEIVKYIRQERPRFDVAFLEGSLKE